MPYSKPEKCKRQEQPSVADINPTKRPLIESEPLVEPIHYDEDQDIFVKDEKEILQAVKKNLNCDLPNKSIFSILHDDFDNDTTSLYIPNSGLNGIIPREIGLMPRTSFIVMRSNQIHGLIPSEIGQLKWLQHLDLSDNQLSGPIPSEIGQLEYMNSIGLSHNQLSGPIPNFDFSKFNGVRLNHNNFTGHISLSYLECEDEYDNNLRVLTLNNNKDLLVSFWCHEILFHLDVSFTKNYPREFIMT